jgi:primosomal protein N' (replication factor Y)
MSGSRSATGREMIDPVPATLSNDLPYADVAVNSGQPVRQPFTYAVPSHLAGVRPGQAVFVPFGPKVLQGIVVGRLASTTIADVRPIAALADDEPVLDEAHIALARWMSHEYVAPLWECIATCLPQGYGQKPVTMISPVAVPPLLPVYPQDQKILRFIAAHGRVTLEALRKAVPGTTVQRLQRLQRDGHLTVVQGLARPAARFKVERRARLLRTPAEAVAHAARLSEARPRSVAARVLLLLAEHPDRPLATLRDAGATAAHVAALAREGWLEEHDVRVERGAIAGESFLRRPPPVLTPDQAAAVEAIARGGHFLLHGVTGAGKTEVYLEAVRRVLEDGKGAIILVPEISLTPQAVRRYGERFGGLLSVFHSGRGHGELHDQWWRTHSGDARVVIGSRSALFAPVHNLGIVILDEEHEPSFKQSDPQPRYHAREAAKELCRLTGASLVLGSATPDVQTYYAAEAGELKRLALEERLQPSGDGLPRPGRLPRVTIVDMREELRTGNRSMFSRPLARAIRQALQQGEQSILFVNRRGAARFMLCRACGHVPVCPTCQVALSLDQAEAALPRLRCHHCGREQRLQDGCPSCGSGKYRPFGVGTQRVEAEARTFFSGARVARWDSDVAGRKGAHEAMVARLEAREIDIVVGTQLLAKGLDLPLMTVVGIVDADVGMSIPDFHAHERAYQLLSQVAGRAGRRDREGFVYIQTYDPGAAPIVAAAAHDYRSFYEHEIAHRRRAGYPPFSRIVRLVHRSTNREMGLDEAARVAADLRLERDALGSADPDILGPMPAFIARIRGVYRWQVLLRGRDPAALVRRARLGDRWAVDVDPVDLL